MGTPELFCQVERLLPLGSRLGSTGKAPHNMRQTVPNGRWGTLNPNILMIRGVNTKELLVSENVFLEPSAHSVLAAIRKPFSGFRPPISRKSLKLKLDTMKTNPTQTRLAVSFFFLIPKENNILESPIPDVDSQTPGFPHSQVGSFHPPEIRKVAPFAPNVPHTPPAQHCRPPSRAFRAWIEIPPSTAHELIRPKDRQSF